MVLPRYMWPVLYLLLFSVVEARAQKKPLLFEHDKVAEQARSELDAMMSAEGALQLAAAEQGIKGEYIIDVTLAGKGRVLSVFMVSSDADEVKQQNMAKDLVRTARFGFKMPKDKTYKFQYTFIFH